jgi:hypothetical protein
MNLNKIKIISKTKLKIDIFGEEDILFEAVSNDQKKFDYYINGIKTKLTKEQDDEISDYIIENIDQQELEWVIANEDYDKIYNTLSFDDICKGYHNKKDVMKAQITKTLDIFILHEKYEKCVILQNLLDKIDKLC